MLNIILRILALIFCRRTGSGNPQRILVLRIDERMGNLILTTPLLAEARRVWPDAQLDVLVSARYAGLLTENKYSIGVIPFEKRALFRRPLSWLKLMLKLRSTVYDLTIDASHEHAFSLTSVLLTVWCGSPLRVGHERKHSECVYTHVAKQSAEGIPEALRKLKLLETLDVISIGEYRPWLGSNNIEAEKWADEWLKINNPAGRKILAVFTGARKADRRLSAIDFLFISKVLKNSAAWIPLFVGGLNDAEQIASLRSLFSECGALFPPELDIYKLRAILALSDAVVCADTGPLHLAWALGRPLLSLHRAGSAARWGHSDKISRALVFTSGSEKSQAEAMQALTCILQEIERHENS